MHPSNNTGKDLTNSGRKVESLEAASCITRIYDHKLRCVVIKNLQQKNGTDVCSPVLPVGIHHPDCYSADELCCKCTTWIYNKSFESKNKLTSTLVSQYSAIQGHNNAL